MPNIQSLIIENCGLPGTTAQLLIYAKKSFVAFNDNVHIAGRFPNANWRYKFDCTIVNGDLNIPGQTLDPTTNSDDPMVEYRAILVDQNGVRQDFLVEDFRLPHDLGDDLTWQQIKTRNETTFGLSPEEFWTVRQAAFIFRTLSTQLSWASILGKPVFGTASALDVAPSGNASNLQVVKGDDSRLHEVLQSAQTFNTAIPFNKLSQYMASHTMVGNITFSANPTNAIAGAVTTVEVIGNGTHDVSFDSSIKFADGSKAFNKSAGVVNYLIFSCIRVGVYCVQILLEAVPDFTAPTVVSATVEDANPDRIVITYSELLNNSSVPANGDFAVSGGKTVTNVSISGAVVTLTVDSDYIATDNITVSYTQGTNKIKDLAGNNAANLTSRAVTNNINPVEIDLIPNTFTNMSGGPTFTHTGGSVWNSFALCQQKLAAGDDGYVKITPNSTGAAYVGLAFIDDAGNYGAANFGIYAFGGFIYYNLNGGLGIATGVGFAAGDKFKLLVDRTAGTVAVIRDRSGVETTAHTFTSVPNSDLFIKFACISAGDSFTLPRGFGVIDK